MAKELNLGDRISPVGPENGPARIDVTNDTASMFCSEIGERVTEEDCEDYQRLFRMTQRGLGAFNVPSPMYRGETVPLQLAVSYAPQDDWELVERYRNQELERSTLRGNRRGITNRYRYQEHRRWRDGRYRGRTTNRYRYQERSGRHGGYIGGAGNQAMPSDGNFIDALPDPDHSGAMPGPAETVESLPGDTVTFVPTVGRRMRAELTGAGFEIRALSPAEQTVPLDGQTTWNWEVKPIRSSAQTLSLRTMVIARGSDGQSRVLKRSVRNQTVNVEVRWYDRLRDALDATPAWIKRIAAILTALGILVGAWYGLKRARKNKKRSAAAPPVDDSDTD